MPIYEYRCVGCQTVVEKVTNAVGVRAPEAIANFCAKEQQMTKHERIISAPALSGSRSASPMSDKRPADAHWKTRVLEGRAPDGRPLTNRVAESAKAWGMDNSARITGKV